MMSFVVILATLWPFLPRCYAVFFVSDELSALSTMKWVLIGISCPSLLFLKPQPVFALSLTLAMLHHHQAAVCSCFSSASLVHVCLSLSP